MRNMILILLVVAIWGCSDKISKEGLDSFGGPVSEGGEVSNEPTNENDPAEAESDPVTVDENKKILASNVVFSSSQPSNLTRSKLEVNESVDTTTRVLAENVIVENDSNSLDADDLQEALDEELAPTASQTLMGAWTCYDSSGAIIGQVNLDGTNFVINSGHCMRMGTNVPGSGCTTPLTYRLVENSFIIVNTNGNAEDCGNRNAPSTGNVTAYITELTNDKVVFWLGAAQIFVIKAPEA